MKHITIDCSSLRSPQEFHRALAEGLEFPEYYGSNLDALYDCLTELGEKTHLTLLHLPDFLGFRETLADAAAENDLLKITIL